MIEIRRQAEIVLGRSLEAALNSLSFNEVRRQLGLTDKVVSHPVFNKIMRGVAPPDPKKRELILETLRKGAASKKSPTSSDRGEHGADILYHLLKLYAEIQRGAKLNTLILTERISRTRNVIRVVDDAEDRATGDELVAAMERAKSYRKQDYTTVQLLTHSTESLPGRLPGHEHVWVLGYYDFMHHLLDILPYAASIEKLVSARGVAPGRHPIQISSIVGGCEVPDIAAELFSQYGTPTAKTIALVARNGGGKTAVALLLADRLMRGNRHNHQFSLPVYIEAARIASTQDTSSIVIQSICEAYNIPPTDRSVMDYLIGNGFFLIIVDGLEESDANDFPTLISGLPMIGQNKAKYLLTFRREVFRNSQDESKCFPPGLGISKHDLQLLAPETASAWLQVHAPYPALVPDLEAGLVKEASMQEGVLSELLRTPLFLQFAASLSAGEFDASKPKALYNIFDKYFESWASRETGHASPIAQHLDKAVRRRFCKEVARYLIINNAQFVSAERMADYSKDWYKASLHTSITELQAQDAVLHKEAQVSMLLVRDVNKDGFRFPHTAFRSFFRAQILIDELQLLCALGLPAREGYAKFCGQTSVSLLSEIALTPADILDVLFTIGGLEQEKNDSADLLRRAMDVIRGRYHNRTLAMNLLTLHARCASAAGKINLAGLNLAGTDLRGLLGEQTPPTLPHDGPRDISFARANLEFAVVH